MVAQMSNPLRKLRSLVPARRVLRAVVNTVFRYVVCFICVCLGVFTGREMPEVPLQYICIAFGIIFLAYASVFEFLVGPVPPAIWRYIKRKVKGGATDE